MFISFMCTDNIQLDIRETDREYHIRADLPGIAKDEVKVTVSANVLTISGERKKEVSPSVVPPYLYAAQCYVLILLRINSKRSPMSIKRGPTERNPGPSLYQAMLTKITSLLLSSTECWI